MSLFTTCRCCKAPTPDINRRFDKVLGSVCPECREASKIAEAALWDAGIKGCEPYPVRYKPQTEEP